MIDGMPGKVLNFMEHHHEASPPKNAQTASTGLSFVSRLAWAQDLIKF